MFKTGSLETLKFKLHLEESIISIKKIIIDVKTKDIMINNVCFLCIIVKIILKKNTKNFNIYFALLKIFIVKL